MCAAGANLLHIKDGGAYPQGACAAKPVRQIDGGSSKNADAVSTPKQRAFSGRQARIISSTETSRLTARQSRSLLLFSGRVAHGNTPKQRAFSGPLFHSTYFSGPSPPLASTLAFLTRGVPVRCTTNLLIEGLRWIGSCCKHFVGHFSTHAEQYTHKNGS